MKTDALIDKMEAMAGQSSEESRKAVLDAHGGIDTLKEMAKLWGEHHYIVGTCPGDIVIAYATAVDVGYRIAQRSLASET